MKMVAVRRMLAAGMTCLLYTSISAKLEQIGNIHSDGRPILGLDCHDLLEIVLELCPSAVYVPAHIWTPHFSLFGAFSGFDTVEECFDCLLYTSRCV